MLTEFTATDKLNAALVFSDGKAFIGSGIGKTGLTTGEICFNVAMTGYQETLTDPSYAGQIINFAYPHIGNVGTNKYDNEKKQAGANGLIIRNKITPPSNYRSEKHFEEWLTEQNITGICGIDTRAVTLYIKAHGTQMAAIYYVHPGVEIKIEQIAARLKNMSNLLGKEMASSVSCNNNINSQQSTFDLQKNHYPAVTKLQYKVVALDFGIKQNILHCLTKVNLDVITTHAKSSFEEIMAHSPDGIFLSNGPADPFAVAKYAIPVIKQLLEINVPIFGICMGHQLLCLASGLDTIKMKQGHRGINHPVKNLQTNKVEITSQNHGFCADDEHLPSNIKITHRSLFDNTIAGIARTDKYAFSVQYHPESSPGPHDSQYLFDDFVKLIEQSVRTKDIKECADA